jgi:putative peptidoglycan lipid II flippase
VAYNIAYNVLQIPIGVIGVPLGVILLPTLSRAVAAGRMAEFGGLLRESLRMLLFVTLWIAAVGIVLRRQTVLLLFGWGFDAEARALTSDTLLFFLLGLPAHCLNVVLARAFYSGQDTRTPVLVAIASVGVNVVVSLATVGTMGLAGLALGIALGGWFDTIVLSLILWKRSQSLDLRSVLNALVVFGVGAALAAFGALAVTRYGQPIFGHTPGRPLLLAEMVAAAVVAGAIYLLYSRLMRVPELTRLVGIIRSQLRRR